MSEVLVLGFISRNSNIFITIYHPKINTSYVKLSSGILSNVRRVTCIFLIYTLAL